MRVSSSVWKFMIAVTQRVLGKGFSSIGSAKPTFPPGRLRLGQTAGGLLEPLGNVRRDGCVRGVVAQQFLRAGKFAGTRWLRLLFGSVLLLLLGGKFVLGFHDSVSGGFLIP